MKLRQSVAAIMFGIAITSTPFIASQAYAAAMPDPALTEQVKARIAHLDQATADTYQRLLTKGPYFKSVSVTTDDYKVVETGATATTSITVKLTPDLTKEAVADQIVLMSKDNIIYGDALTASGVLARIESEFVANDSLKNLMDIDSEAEFKELSSALQYLHWTTDLLPEGQVKQVVSIKPFETKEDNVSINFDGLTLNSAFNEDTITDMVLESELAFKELTMSKKEPSNGTSQTNKTENFTLAPFSMNYSLDKDGDMRFNSSAIHLKFDSDDDQVTFDIAGIKGKGSDLHYNDDLATFTGNQEFVIDKITFNGKELQVPIVINSTRITADIDQDGNNFDLHAGYEVDIDGESIASATGMDNLDLRKVSFDATVDNFNPMLYNFLNNELPVLIDDKHTEALQQRLEEVFTNIVDNQSGLSSDIAINTAQGNVSLSLKLAAKNSFVKDTAQWEAAFKADEPLKVINLIQQSIDFDISISIPESLVQALQMESMIAMGTGYIVKKDGSYIMHIKNTDDGIELNGNLMPLPQQ